jgi:hypothetical protein
MALLAQVEMQAIGALGQLAVPEVAERHQLRVAFAIGKQLTAGRATKGHVQLRLNADI